MKLLRTSFLTCALLAAPLFSQRTLIVDAANGPGTDYTDFGAAVAAARDLDTLIVRAGSYPGALVDRPIRILGEGAPSIVGPGSPLRIRNIAVGETVVVRGIRFGFGPLAIDNCAGHVHLEDLRALPPFLSPGALIVERSAQVSAQRCVFTNVRISSSTVLLTDSVAQGVGTLVGAGDPALVATGSRVTIAGGQYVGGSAYISLPGVGIRSTMSQLLIAGSNDTRIAAGTAQTSALSASAVDATGGRLTIDPRVRLEPFNNAPPIGGNAPTRRASLPFLSTALRGRQMQISAFAPPGSRVYVLGGPSIRPLLFGDVDLWLGTAHVVLGQGVVPSSGVLPVQIGLPVLPPGTSGAQQAVVLQGVALSLSTPLVTRYDG